MTLIEQQHECYIKLMKMGATQEDIIELFKIAFEVVNEMAEEATK